MVVPCSSDFTGFEQMRQCTSFCSQDLSSVFSQFRSDPLEVKVTVNGLLINGIQGEFCSSHALEFTCFCLWNQSEFIESQASIDGPLSHGNVMLLTSGEVCEREWEDLRCDQSHLSVNGSPAFQLLIVVATNCIQHIRVNVADSEAFFKHRCVENDTDFGIASAFDISDSRKAEDCGSDRFMIFRFDRNDQIQISDCFLSSSCASCQLCFYHAINLSHTCFKRLSVHQSNVQPSPCSEAG